MFPVVKHSVVFVAQLCNKSFLSLRSYPSPKRAENKKELCDLLVINDPWIIIVTVKEVSIPSTKDISVDIDRRVRKSANRRKAKSAKRH